MATERNTILYQAGRYTVRPETFGNTKGFAVYQDEGVASIRVASIGYPGAKGYQRAKTEADRRAAL